MNRILALAVDMLPGTATGIVGVLEEDEVRILSGVGTDIKLLEDLPLKADHVVFRGATVSFALLMDRWPEDLRERFSRICPDIAEGLMVNLRAGGRVLGSWMLWEVWPRVFSVCSSFLPCIAVFRRTFSGPSFPFSKCTMPIPAGIRRTWRTYPGSWLKYWGSRRSRWSRPIGRGSCMTWGNFSFPRRFSIKSSLLPRRNAKLFRPILPRGERCSLNLRNFGTLP